MIITAKLIKRRTDDGLFEMADGVPLGKVYRVDTSTRRWMFAVEPPSPKIHDVEVIEEYITGRLIPIEMVELGGAPE